MNEKIITRSGSWFKYGEVYLGQGKEKARQHLVENPAVTQELREKILASGVVPPIAAGESESAAEANGEE